MRRAGQKTKADVAAEGRAALSRLMDRYAPVAIEDRTPDDHRDIRLAKRAGLIQKLTGYETTVDGDRVRQELSNRRVSDE